MKTLQQKAEAFRKLHEAGTFVIPNPWDIGSAKVLAELGYQALATTSAGYAFTLGKPDGDGVIGRDATLANFKEIVDATDLPVSADLQGGFGKDPKAVAETIRRAAEIGLCGGSIEDSTGDAAKPIYDFGFAKERVAAAVEAARASKHPFTLTARSENFLVGNPDLDDTIKRLQAFAAAGADVLYAPGLRDLASMKLVASSVGKPINVVMSAGDPALSAAEMEAVGVKRISVGGALSRLALAAFMKGAREMKDTGGFTWMRDTMATKDLKPVFKG
jgi:2-methylisocitrate lyase-like PEP mutase family enzyme